MDTDARPADLAAPRSTPQPTASVRVVGTGVGAHLLLEVTGEADLDTARALRKELAAALSRRPRSVTLEVSRLTYRDLAGLDALDDFCAEATLAGVRPVVRGMSPRLAWLHAHLAATDRMPAGVSGSTAPSDPLSEHRRRSMGGAHLGMRPADHVASPRPWPER